MTRIFLINVGANLSHQGRARCPLFPDGTFVYVPFPLDGDEGGRWPYPTNAWPFTYNLRWHQTHVDPDWPYLTYGDYFSNPRAAALHTLVPHDILLFWALLWDNDGDNWFDFSKRRSWHLIGSLRIEEALWPGQAEATQSLQIAFAPHITRTSMRAIVPLRRATSSSLAMWLILLYSSMRYHS